MRLLAWIAAVLFLMPVGAAHGASVAALHGQTAKPPPDAPRPVERAIRAANRIAGKPYVWGGGHARWRPGPARGYDCSGSTSYVLEAARVLKRVRVAADFRHWRRHGRGRWITVYASHRHVWLRIAGRRFDTSGSPSGPRWRRDPRGPAGFVRRHAAGL